jgi:hypothetical protein
MTSANDGRRTVAVRDEIFQQVYDSPASLPGKERWVTRDEDVREIERLLGMESDTIGAPLWISGDTRHCPKCDREVSWLDIVSSALKRVHDKRMIAEVILGETRYVNVEVPDSIRDVHCFACQSAIEGIRSFKCHNWAYAKPQMLEVLERIG